MGEKILSIVVPCYNEEAVLTAFYEEIRKTAEVISDRVSCELLFIDDGSGDATLSIIRSLAESDERIKYVSFSRNFGKEAAIYAGLQHATGDYVVLMDADLQHPPEFLPQMLDGILLGSYDSVAMRRVDRKGEKRVRSWFSRRFYRINQKISGVDIPEGATDYRMMTRQMADAVLSMPEVNRFTKGIFTWVGFRTLWIPYHNVERSAGSSKWTFWGLVKYSMNGIVAFSTMPLAIASILGALCCAVSVLMAVWFVLKTLIWGDPVPGFPTLITVILFLGGVQLLMIGILGQYFSKMYLEIKHRPMYIAKEQNTAERKEKN
ncbi:MAG: glycosyltransferase family 2 protein [Lachnospiraceae bacterium]|nr:glycosyltransferase family 2 protein [Lachnospiraceae bacterium]